MSRRDRSSRQRRAHRAKLHARREQHRLSMQRAPARTYWLGFGRRGDAAALSFDFTGPEVALTPADLATEDPGDALPVRCCGRRGVRLSMGLGARGEGPSLHRQEQPSR